MRVTCKQASHLICAELDGRLGFGQRLVLRLHLLACAACVRVKAQMGFLRRAMTAYVNQDSHAVQDKRDSGDSGKTPPDAR